MWKSFSKHNSRGIYAESFRSFNDNIEGKFNVGIFFSSFESRCSIGSQLIDESSCDSSIIVLFTEKDDLGLRDKHDPELFKYVAACSKATPIVIDNFSIRNVEEIIAKILHSIPENSSSDRCKWFIDITTCPKPFFMSILGYFRGMIDSPQFTLFNATAHYEKNINPPDAFTFTKGFGQYMWVPWLWGNPDPRLPWTYFFLLGFEGNLSYSTFERFEPQFVQALFSYPGYRKNYPQEALKQNKEFLKEARPKLLYADAADTVQTWRRIEHAIIKQKTRTNICIVSFGPKPQALAGCLHALTDGNPGVLYLMPKSHKVRDIPRGDYIWKYEVSL